MAEKDHINLVFIGHVDHGKSTLVGRILYDAGVMSEQEKQKLEKLAEEHGKPGFGFAYAMDKIEEERKRGVTIDLSYVKFETPKHIFTIIDAPGHADFVKNMITGTSQADAAVLVVAATDGVMPQTQEHAQLAKVLGVNQIIVAINKMDAVNYDQAKFNEVKEAVEKLLKTTGYKEFTVVPVSALMGENITKKTDKMPWWNGGYLLEEIDKFKAPEQPIDKPLRLPIQDVYSIKGVGTVPVGRVESGTMKPGDKIIFEPEGIVAEVKSIEEHHQAIPVAKPGDNIGFNIRNVSKKDISRGSVVSHVDTPATVAKEFKARIVVMRHPTGISVGYTPVFHIHTAQVACTITQILEKIDPRTGDVVEQNPTFLKNGDVATVIIKPTVPIAAEPVSEFPSLGRFAVRDMGRTVAAGVIVEITQKG